MRVAQLGEGRPAVAVVGALHGDEPCGARAIERILLEAPDVRRPVKFIVANERALEAGVRYVDTDLNRSFEEGGNPHDHEYSLAGRLAEELAGCTALSIHSTQSHAEPFGIVSGLGGDAEDLVQRLPIEALVTVQEPEGRPFAIQAATLLEIEAGYQQSAAASRNAYQAVQSFLSATDALPGEIKRREVPTFDLGDPIDKPPAAEYAVYAENFSLVSKGQVYARADDRELRAESRFYPVLFSAGGYTDIFGYAGDRIED